MSRVAAPAFESLTLKSLKLEDITALTEARAGTLRVPAWLSPAWSQTVSARFLGSKPPIFERSKSPAVESLELGPLGSRFSKRPDGYFKAAAAAAPKLRGLYAGGDDPLLKLQREFAAATGYKQVEASALGKPLGRDLVWGLMPGSAGPTHCDVLSFREWLKEFAAPMPHLLSWNVYLSTADKGGELGVYRQHALPEHQPKDDTARWVQSVPDYGPLLRGVPRAAVTPGRGDLVLFDLRNYHEVSRTAGKSVRLSAHGLIGLDPVRRKVCFWV